MTDPARMPWLLMYHSVADYDEDPHLITVRPETFARQLAWLRARRLRGVSVRELLSGDGRGMVWLTFDDGYADFATEVVPVLLAHGFTATVYVVAGCVGGENSWDEGPRKPLMTADQIRNVAELGMEVASHGLRHVSLPEATDVELKNELVESQAVLADILGREVTGFAYPYGHAGAREAAAAEECGYDHACAIWPSPVSGRHALARTYVGDRDEALRLRAKAVRHRLKWRGRL